MSLQLTIIEKRWALNKPFQISREVTTHAETVICEITDGQFTGRGEAAGVSYDDETVVSIIDQVESVANIIEGGITRDNLQDILPPGGARNSIDCALWDLEAKRSGKTVWQMLGWDPRPVTTVYTVGIATPDVMEADASAHSDYPFIKVKVGLGDPLEQTQKPLRRLPGFSARARVSRRPTVLLHLIPPPTRRMGDAACSRQSLPKYRLVALQFEQRGQGDRQPTQTSHLHARELAYPKPSSSVVL